MSCRMPACGKPVQGRGLCGMHWSRQYRHGSPEIVLRRRGPLVERFRARHTVLANGCWQWDTVGNTGYGTISDESGRTVFAHRVAYELHVGPIPHGLQIDHLCRNRGCVNPSHLEAVEQSENLRRGRVYRAAHITATA